MIIIPILCVYPKLFIIRPGICRLLEFEKKDGSGGLIEIISKYVSRPDRSIELKNWPWQLWKEIAIDFFWDRPGPLIETFWKNSDQVV